MTDNKRFTDNGDNTITDLKMKLIWKKTDSFQDTKNGKTGLNVKITLKSRTYNGLQGQMNGGTQMRKRHGVYLTLATKTLINMAMIFISTQYLDQDPVEQHGPVKRKILQLLSYNTKMA